ncbi:MAG TPA: AsmA family protein [Rhodospirillaceae bacterium]|nr:AsmA family protein [Rhodospirillaceae bacterium]
MRARGFAIAGVLLAALAILGLAPRFIDWNSRCDQLAGRLERVLGRELRIEGVVAVAFLPRPTIILRQVTIGNLAGAVSPALAVLPEVEMRFSLASLLSGRLALTHLRLVNPELRLETLADGQANWHFTKKREGGPAPEAGLGGIVSGLRQTDGLAIEEVIIDEGRLSYQRAHGPSFGVEGLSGTLELSPSGIVRLKGTSLLAGRAVLFTGEAGPWGETTPLTLTLSPAGEAGELHLAGQVSGAGGERHFSGKVTAKSPALGNLVAGLPALPWQLQGTLLATPVALDLPAVTFDLAGQQMSGSVRLGWGPQPMVDIRMAANHLDLDGPAKGPVIPSTLAQNHDFPAPPPVEARSWLPAALPKALAASVDLSVEALRWQGGLWRSLRLNAALSNGEITINQARGQLPGQTEAALFGFLALEEGRPAFDGSIEASSDDLRGLLSWLKLDLAAVPPDRLRRARLAAQLKAVGTEVTLADAHLQVDGAHIETSLTARLGERPRLEGVVAVDAWNADAYRSQAQPPVQPPSEPAPGRKAEEPLPPPAPPWFVGWDGALRLHLGRLIYEGQVADAVDLDASWEDQLFKLRSLAVGNLAGGQGRIYGEIAGLGGPKFQLHGVHYALSSAHPLPWLRLAGLADYFDPERLGAMVLSGVVDGDTAHLTLESRTELGGAVVTAAGVIEDLGPSARLHLALEGSHASFSDFLKLLAVDRGWPVGGGSLASRLDGDLQNLTFQDLRLKAGPIALAGQISLHSAGKPTLEAVLTADALPIDLFFAEPPVRRPGAMTKAEAAPSAMAAPRPAVHQESLTVHWSRDPLNLAWLQRFDAKLRLSAQALLWQRWRVEAPALELSLADGQMILTSLTGRLFGGTLGLSGGLSSQGRVAVEGAVQNAQLQQALLAVADLQFVQGLGDLSLRLDSSGQSWAEWMGRLAGSGQLAIRQGVIKGFDLAAVVAKAKALDSPAGLLALLQAGISGGATKVNRLSSGFSLRDGILEAKDLALEADGGGAKGAIEINLPAYVMDAHADFSLADLPDLPPLVMRLSGPLDSPRRVLDINPLQSWLASRALGKAPKGKDLLKGVLQLR